MSTAIVTIGDLVTVTLRHGRRTRRAKARLTGWEYGPSVDGRMRYRPVVTYTSTGGERHSALYRERGEDETVRYSAVTPRGFTSGEVTFRQGPEDVYARSILATVSHGPQGGTVTRIN